MSYWLRNIDDLLSKTEYVLKEVKARFKNPCMLWSTGKDSTALLHMIKDVFYEIPFDIVHIDTQKLFPEMYEFRDDLVKKWNIPLKIAKKEDCKELLSLDEDEIFKCCMCRKTLNFKELFLKEHYDAAILGIRWDELGVRGKEHYFSPRTHKWEWRVVRTKTPEEMKEGDAPVVSLTEPEVWNLYQCDFGEGYEHVRVHPILHWSELEIWEYIKRNNIPWNKLYKSKNGFRYRSLGCMKCTSPIKSDAKTIEEFEEEIYNTKTREREGRRQKDSIMEKLRYLGYM